MMMLILIANTGNTGAKISHIILHPLISSHQIFMPPHGNLTSSFNQYATIPRGINAMIHRNITTLIIRVNANATNGIKSATLMAHLSKNSVTPLRVVAVVLSSVSCTDRLEKSNKLMYNVINGQTIPFDLLMRVFMVSQFSLLYGVHHVGIKVVCRLLSV